MLVTASIFGMVTSITMIGPLLVDLAREFGISVGAAGLLAAATAVPQAIGSPFAGLVSDRLGRRPMIVVALGSVGVTSLAAAGAPGFAALIAVRFLTGLLASCGPTSLMAAIGDLFAAARRAQAMSWFNMGFSLAAIAGVPAIGAIGGWLGWRWAFAVNGGAMLALALCVQLGFPAPPPPATRTSVAATYRAVWGVSKLANVLGANLVERSLFAMIALYLPSFLMLRYDRTAIGVAPLLSIVALGTIVGNLFGGWLGDRLSRPAIFIAAQLTAGALGVLLFGPALPLAAAVTIAAVLGFANATSRPGFLAFSSELAPQHRGALFGLIALSNQSGLVVGSALGAFVVGAAGYGAMAVMAAVQGAMASIVAVPLVIRPLRGRF
jgi:predicted MFS family arabinose efflux permease